MAPILPDDRTRRPMPDVPGDRRSRVSGRRNGSAAFGLGEIEKHERPADGAKLLVDAGPRAPAAVAPIRLRAFLVLPPLAFAPVEDHLDTLVTGERALDLLVELPAMPRHDEEVLDNLALFRRAARELPGAAVGAMRARRRHQIEETRGRGPGAAAAGGTCLSPEGKALVAV